MNVTNSLKVNGDMRIPASLEDFSINLGNQRRRNRFEWVSPDHNFVVLFDSGRVMHQDFGKVRDPWITHGNFSCFLMAYEVRYILNFSLTVCDTRSPIM